MDDKASTNTDRFDKIDLQLDIFDKKFDKKFDNIDLQLDIFDKKFDNIDRRFLEVDQHFDILTFYMTKRFDDIDVKFDVHDKRFDRLDNVLDSFLKKQETDIQERLVMGHQISRIDVWTHELANKIGHKLTI